MLVDGDSISTGPAVALYRVLAEHAAEWVFVQNSPDPDDQVQAALDGSLDGLNWYPIGGAAAGAGGLPSLTLPQLTVNGGKPARFLRVRIAALVGDVTLTVLVTSRP